MNAVRPDVALFLPRLEGGGAERVMLDLAAALADDGLRVQMVLASRGGTLDGELPHGVTRVDLGVDRTRAALLPLRAYLQRTRPRALLATLEHANVVALLASRGVRAVHISVREANTASVDLAGGDVRQRALLLLMRWLYRRADTVIAVSNGVADDLRYHLRLPGRRLQVIANPVLTPRVFSLAADVPDHPWFSDGGAPLVLGVGRLTRQKRFDVLLRAFAVVRSQRACRLALLGEGEERDALQALAHELGVLDDVAFAGFVPNPFACMARASLFVLSSAWEGLPNVLIQALALGTPAVATNCPSGPREILDDARLGRLVPVDDVAAMSEAINAMLARGERVQPSSAWLERYDHRSVARRYARALGVA